MRSENILQQKSFAFAVRIYKLSRFLVDVKKENVLSKQLLRSGTSIGANIEEAAGGQTDKDFFAKINISYKEARETLYWLKLIKECDLIDQKQAESIMPDCEELLKLLGSAIRTMKQRKVRTEE